MDFGKGFDIFSLFRGVELGGLSFSIHTHYTPMFRPPMEKHVPTMSNRHNRAEIATGFF